MKITNFLKNTSKSIYFFGFYTVFSEISINLISIYLPVIIYIKFANINLIFLYLIIVFFSQALFNFLLKKLFCKKYMIFILILILPLILLNVLINVYINSSVLYVIILGIVASLVKLFSYIPNSKVLTLLIEGEEAKQIGFYRAAQVLGKIISPILGGYVLVGLSDFYLTIISVCLYLVAFVFLLLCIKTINKTNSVQRLSYNIDTQDKVYKKLYRRIFIKFFILNFAIGMSIMGDRSLAVFQFIENFNVQSVGFVVAVFNIGDLCANLLAGKISSKRWGQTFAIICCVTYCLLWIGIIFANALWVFIISLALGFTYPFVGVLIHAVVVKNGNIFNKQDNLIALREYSQQLGGLINCLLCLVFGSFKLGFLLSGIAFILIAFFLIFDKKLFSQ